MARYGDLERLEQHFYNCADECRNTCDEWGAKCFETAMKATKNQPTADVVPRAEVDKARQQGYESGKREVAREILEKAASKFAGHSDYHGDTILQVLYCMAEGKEVDNAKPLDAKQSGPFSRPHENDGEWILCERLYDYEVDTYKCSQCKTSIRDDEKRKMKFCPNCGAKMTGSAENVTDINVGNKSTEEGDYFTPAQVRAMTAAEVKANYAKILTSMSKWH